MAELGLSNCFCGFDASVINPVSKREGQDREGAKSAVGEGESSEQEWLTTANGGMGGALFVATETPYRARPHCREHIRT